MESPCDCLPCVSFLHGSALMGVTARLEMFYSVSSPPTFQNFLTLGELQGVGVFVEVLRQEPFQREVLLCPCRSSWGIRGLLWLYRVHPPGKCPSDGWSDPLLAATLL